jgi:hypothetical protein
LGKLFAEGFGPVVEQVLQILRMNHLNLTRARK